MIKFNREEQNAIRFFAEEYGVEIKALTEAVSNYIENAEQKKQMALTKIKNIQQISESESDVKQLRKEICLGSIYLSDYENSFGIDREILCNIMDGYCEELQYWADEEGKGDWDWLKIVKHYDTVENLQNYLYGVEWDEKYLKQMTAEAVEEINEQYNARERLFEEEKIFYIASELQYKMVA